jgi:hypothetical protein
MLDGVTEISLFLPGDSSYGGPFIKINSGKTAAFCGEYGFNFRQTVFGERK